MAVAEPRIRTEVSAIKRPNSLSMVWRQVARNWQLYLFLALPLAWLLVFMYYPMYGAQIAFRDFLPGR